MVKVFQTIWKEWYIVLNSPHVGNVLRHKMISESDLSLGRIAIKTLQMPFGIVGVLLKKADQMNNLLLH
jgi:hypothetical protein